MASSTTQIASPDLIDKIIALAPTPSISMAASDIAGASSARSMFPASAAPDAAACTPI
jgi:hypothetical protein